jgi:hypothetical protein
MHGTNFWLRKGIGWMGVLGAATCLGLAPEARAWSVQITSASPSSGTRVNPGTTLNATIRADYTADAPAFVNLNCSHGTLYSWADQFMHSVDAGSGSKQWTVPIRVQNLAEPVSISVSIWEVNLRVPGNAIYRGHAPTTIEYPVNFDNRQVMVWTQSSSGTTLDAKIYVDGVEVGTATWVGTLASGQSIRVSFGPMDGYTTPSAMTITAGGVYKVLYQPIGSSQVTIRTQDRAGLSVPGSIYINGELVGTGSWSGDLDFSRSHVISFGELPGYPKPASRTITTGGTYIGVYGDGPPPPPPPYSVTIHTRDEAGNAVQGPIHVDWVARGVGSWTGTFPAGSSHSVSFGLVEGYLTPADQSFNSGRTITGVYRLCALSGNVAFPADFGAFPFTLTLRRAGSTVRAFSYDKQERTRKVVGYGPFDRLNTGSYELVVNDGFMSEVRPVVMDSPARTEHFELPIQNASAAAIRARLDATVELLRSLGYTIPAARIPADTRRQQHLILGLNYIASLNANYALLMEVSKGTTLSFARAFTDFAKLSSHGALSPTLQRRLRLQMERVEEFSHQLDRLTRIAYGANVATLMANTAYAVEMRRFQGKTQHDVDRLLDLANGPADPAVPYAKAFQRIWETKQVHDAATALIDDTLRALDQSSNLTEQLLDLTNLDRVVDAETAGKLLLKSRTYTLASAGWKVGTLMTQLIINGRVKQKWHLEAELAKYAFQNLPGQTLLEPIHSDPAAPPRRRLAPSSQTPLLPNLNPDFVALRAALDSADPSEIENALDHLASRQEEYVSAMARLMAAVRARYDAGEARIPGFAGSFAENLVLNLYDALAAQLHLHALAGQWMVWPANADRLAAFKAQIDTVELELRVADAALSEFVAQVRGFAAVPVLNVQRLMVGKNLPVGRPAPVSVWVENPGDLPVEEFVVLLEGDAEGIAVTPASHEVALLAPGETRELPWTIQCAPELTGSTVTLMVGGYSTLQSVVLAPLTRSVHVQADEYTSPLLSTGWNMISVPVILHDLNPASSISPSVAGPLQLYRFVAGGYRAYTPNDPESLPLHATHGFWFWLPENTTLRLHGLPVMLLDPAVIALQTGWNQIGSPFGFPVAWGTARVRVTEGDTTRELGIAEAHAAEIARNYIYWYEAGGQKMATAPHGVLKPWFGYWVRAERDCELLLEPTQAEED